MEGSEGQKHSPGCKQDGQTLLKKKGRWSRNGGTKGKEGKREGGKEGKELSYIGTKVFHEVLIGAQERNWGSQVGLRLQGKPSAKP